MKVLASDEIKLLTYQLKGGSETAFRTLYNIHAVKLYNNLLYLVKSEDIAKELLQDVFLKIWSQKELIDPDKSFKFFIYKIGQNLIYDYFRKVSRDKKLAEDFVKKTAHFYTHIEEDLYCKDISFILNKAINELSPQRKQAFVLCKLEGKSYKEVSQILGISVSTISDHIVKATRSIKAYLSFNEDIAV